MDAKHNGAKWRLLLLCITVLLQGRPACGELLAADQQQADRSFIQEPQLKEVAAGDPVPDAVHQQELQAHNLQHTGLAEDLAGDNPDTKGQARIRAPVTGSRTKSISAFSVLLMTAAMASASGIGALPFFFVGALSKEWAALANAVACGVMLAASFDLLHEGQPYGAGLVIFGLILGALFINATQEKLQQYEDIKFQGLQGANARKLVLVVGIMAAHALGEGSGVGVSFCGTRGWAQGLLVTLAIGLHNIPEGLAVATVLVGKGISAKRAFWWTLFTAAPQPLVALPSFLFVDTFFQLLPLALGFAAGCMLWMVFAELLPDALNDAKHSKIATAATFSAAWLEGLRMMLARFEQPDGGFSVMADTLDLRDTVGKCTALLAAAVPAAVIGACMGPLVPQTAASFGAAAGVAAWVGLADTAYRLGRDPKLQAVRFLASIAAGGGVAVLLSRSKQGARQGKAKVDPKDEDGPPRSGDLDWQVVSASDRSLLLPETTPPSSMLPTLHPVAARRLSKGVPLGAAQLQAAVWGVLALSLHGVPEGWIVAETVQNHGGVSHAWVPAALRAALKACAVALLAPHMGWGSAALAGSASLLMGLVGPLVAAFMILQGPAEEATRQGLGMQEVSGACLGVLLATAGGLLWPAARQGRKRAGRAGFVLGFLGGAAVHALMEALCWTSSWCLVM